LYKNLLLSVPASFLCATVIFFGLYRSSDTVLLSWYIVVLIISLFRLVTYLSYFKGIKKSVSMPVFILGTVLSGATWGFCASYLMPPENLLQQMIIVVIIAGITAGGVQTLQASLVANCLYISAIILPLIIWLFSQMGSSYFTLGIAMFIFFAFMLITALRGYKILEQSLMLRYENAGLVKNLSVTNHELLKSYHTIEEKLTELQQQEVEMRYISKVNEMLQSCQKSNEAYLIIRNSSKELFPGFSGALVVFETSSQGLQIRQWGNQQILKKTFLPQECWALLKEHPYCINDTKKGSICQHFETIPAGGYICLPQILKTDVVGVLILYAPQGGIISLHQQQLATSFNDTIKLSLANIRLHEILSEQSIHDPVTQLYNRRFLDETLPRELLRSQREKSHLCVCMVDIDILMIPAGMKRVMLSSSLLASNWKKIFAGVILPVVMVVMNSF